MGEADQRLEIAIISVSTGLNVKAIEQQESPQQNTRTALTYRLPLVPLPLHTDDSFLISCAQIKTRASPHPGVSSSYSL